MVFFFREKVSDGCWDGEGECPDDLLAFSDDEAERRYNAKRRHKKNSGSTFLSFVLSISEVCGYVCLCVCYNQKACLESNYKFQLTHSCFICCTSMHFLALLLSIANVIQNEV